MNEEEYENYLNRVEIIAEEDINIELCNELFG